MSNLIKVGTDIAINTVLKSLDNFIYIVYIEKGKAHRYDIISGIDLANHHYHIAMYDIDRDRWEGIEIGLKLERYSMACTIHQTTSVKPKKGQSIYLFGGIYYRSGIEAKVIERCDIKRFSRQNNPCEYIDSMEHTRSNFHASGLITV